MDSAFDLSIVAIVMPVLVAIGILVIVVVLIVVHGKTRQIQSTAISQQSFEELSLALKADHAILKQELAAIKETLNSINTMMEEIQ